MKQAVAYKPEKMILTAGPSITDKEVNYVLDAVKNGWNENWSGYIRKFEQSFADFIGVKHALALSSCTGAMHLSLLALGVQEGDEVIIPDLGWVAAANVVKYVGAEPVFVDVLEDTWCLDPQRMKEAMTDKTKAIIPVHLYGHPCDMDAINQMAKEHGLAVVEDAAQSIGSLYKGKRLGGLGQTGCFSFQGAKIMVTGEGGMLVTDDQALYEKAKFYNDHGRDPKGSFWIYEVGHKYKISNLQAALGLAQLERIDELVNQKRQVFQWYESFLRDVDGITLNAQKSDVLNSYWMSSIVLDEKVNINRDQFMKSLKEKYLVDSRAFFYPTSEFKPFTKRFNNSVSKRLGERGINLPSGYHLREEEIEYIAKSIRELLEAGP